MRFIRKRKKNMEAKKAPKTMVTRKKPQTVERTEETVSDKAVYIKRLKRVTFKPKATKIQR